MKFSHAFGKIAKLTDRIRVIQGAGGSSKTYSILQYLIILASKSKKKLTISVVSESMPHLRRGAMKDFFDILETNGLYEPKNHNKSTFSYNLGRCKIEFFGVEDAAKLRGARRDILFVNEANNISHDAFTQLKIRTSEFIFLDYNPSHLAWVREYIEEDKSNFIKLNYLDNQFLHKEVIKDYEKAIEKAEKGSSYWQNFVSVYVWGEEGSIQGAIYEFDVIDAVPETAEYIGTGLDFGWTDPHAAVKVYRNGEDEIILKEFLYKSQMLNPELARILKTDEEISKGLIICDNARPEIIAELKLSNLITKAIKKPMIIDRIVLAKQFNIRVTKDSENLIKELQNYVWDTNNENEAISVPKPNQQDHLLDAFSYLIWDRLNIRSRNTKQMPFLWVA